ncbi:MAG TPA: sugar ABC transporter permease [Ruminiclostridium sp.]
MNSIIFSKNKFAQILFSTPVIIIYSLIIIIPLIQAFIMSFTNWDGVNTATYAGLANYKMLFTSPNLKVSLINSVIYSAILVTYQLTLGTLFATILVNSTIKFKRIFKDIYFFPVLLSVSVVAQLWLSIYHGDFGLLNQILKMLDPTWSQNWLAEPTKGIIAIVLAESWKGMGYHMLIIYAAMRNVPRFYYEAATIDGASPTQQFFNITFPLIGQTLKVCFIMCVTFGFRAFEQIFIMTSGGPVNYTYTMSIMMYKALFGLQKYGYSNAIAVFIVVICVGIMLMIERAFRNTHVEY